MKTLGKILGLAVMSLLFIPASARAEGWSATGSMSVARWGHTATLLNDGTVLVAGGAPSAELYDPATAIWTITGTLSLPGRLSHTATLLTDGRVLVAGGCIDSNCAVLTATAELYDPATRAWTNTGNMNVRRADHTATLLSDGRVLVTGGGSSTLTATAELYDPATGTWTNTGNMNVRRADHTATLLNDGRVLVAGGAIDIANFTATVEHYDPATGTWMNTDSMGIARARHTATLLNDGTVLVAGGCLSHCFLESATMTAELFNPSMGTWGGTGNMADAREFHTATRLANGKVLVTGGLLVEL